MLIIEMYMKLIQQNFTTKSISIIKLIVIGIFLGSSFSELLFSQISNDKVQVYNWKTESSVTNALTSTIDKDSNIWVGTTGGIFRYNLLTQESKIYRNISDLISSHISYITNDHTDGNIYASSIDGIIEIFDAKTQKWSHITDIKNSNYTNTTVRDMAIDGDRIFMVGGFGMTLFDKKSKVFREEARRYGRFQPNSDTRKILIHDNKIWVATIEGVASIDLNKSIADRNNWTNYTLNGQSILDMSVYEDTLFVASNNTIYKFVDNSFENANFVEHNFIQFINTNLSNGLMYMSDSSGVKFVFQLNDNSNYNLKLTSNNVTSISSYISNSKSNLIVNYTNSPTQLMTLTTPVIIKDITPNTPSVNSFEDIKVYFDNQNGEEVKEIWVATGADNGNGIMCFREGKWINVNMATLKKYFNRTIHKVNINKQGDIFCSSYGDGLFVLKRKGAFNENDISTTFDVIHYTPSNSPIVGFQGGNGFPIIGDVKFDRDGSAYIINWGENIAEGPILIKLDKDNNFTTYQNCINRNNRFHYNLLIDENNTKWIASSFAKINNLGGTVNTGMMYYNDKRENNAGNNICGIITTSNFPNIKSNTQTALAQDKTGIIWIGTTNGLVALFNPGSALFNNPNFAIKEVVQLNNLEIFSIYVDAINNKWIGTSQGVYVLNAEGTEVLLTLNRDNSPITSNTIYSINGDENTGEIYIGSSGDMYIVNTYSIRPQDNYNLKITPQPFNPNIHDEIQIDGLAENSEIKIMTISGEVVKTLFSNSKTIIWDGRDEGRKKVSSGVYLVSVSSGNSERSGVTKFAVVW